MTIHHSYVRRSLVHALAFWLVAVAAAGAAVAGETLVGPARVVDGDTLEISGRTVRLIGILAPAIDQKCQRDGQDWPCGRKAADRMQELIAGRPVRCLAAGRDSDGATAGLCFAGGLELNRALVADGYAVARHWVGLDYDETEETAKAARLGIWSGSFTDPEAWRARHASAEAKPAS